jgi:hypothetical protein
MKLTRRQLPAGAPLTTRNGAPLTNLNAGADDSDDQTVQPEVQLELEAAAA